MGQITFILGGARSGKSNHALELAKKNAGKTAFLATCKPRDREMEKRVAAHRRSRPAGWQTFEEEEDLLKPLKSIGKKFNVVIIDCLTLWVSNLLLKGSDGINIEKRINDTLKFLKKMKTKTIIVANEVGLGIVPANRLSREFRDIAGRVNQITAAAADEVVFMVSGLPLMVKGNVKNKIKKQERQPHQRPQREKYFSVHS